MGVTYTSLRTYAEPMHTSRRSQQHVVRTWVSKLTNLTSCQGILVLEVIFLSEFGCTIQHSTATSDLPAERRQINSSSKHFICPSCHSSIYVDKSKFLHVCFTNVCLQCQSGEIDFCLLTSPMLSANCGLINVTLLPSGQLHYTPYHIPNLYDAL